MLSPIPYAGNLIADKHMYDFVSSLTDEEFETHKRAMYRWEMWYHSMEVE
jgi:hypothetical protein